MNWRIHVCALILFTGLFAAAQTPFTPVVPNLMGQEGNSASSTPFNQTGVRFQQVYDASQFSSVVGWIREIEFRVDAGGAGMDFLNATLSNIQISVSTTLRQPDSLSPVFADNVGLNNNIVYLGPLTMSGRNAHFPGGPNTFESGVRFTTPFFYDPAQGNLLLDVRNYFGAATSPFDAVNSPGDPVSSLFALGADSTSGTLSTVGLVTLFVIDPVPEPSTWALVVSGLIVFALSVCTRQKAKD
jgi:hypothetical protein